MGEDAPPYPTWVDGYVGQAVQLNADFYGAVEVPSDFLARPGAISLWLQPGWKLSASAPGQRSIFHLQGAEPFAPALTLCTIYGDLRVRLYDLRGHLCSALEADAIAWEPGEWHQVVLTWAEGAMALAFDGQEVAFTPHVTLPQGTFDTLFLGWRAGNWFLNANVDGVVLMRGWWTAEE